MSLFDVGMFIVMGALPLLSVWGMMVLPRSKGGHMLRGFLLGLVIAIATLGWQVVDVAENSGLLAGFFQFIWLIILPALLIAVPGYTVFNRNLGIDDLGTSGGVFLDALMKGVENGVKSTLSSLKGDQVPTAEPNLETDEATLFANGASMWEEEFQLAREPIQEALDSFTSYHTDLEKSLKAPLLLREDLPEIQDLVIAHADLILMSKGQYSYQRNPEIDKIPFIRKGREFRKNFRVLEARALRSLREDWSENELKDIEQAINLLTRARDQGNHVAERQTAYERVFKIMERLRIAPEKTVFLEISGADKLALEA